MHLHVADQDRRVQGEQAQDASVCMDEEKKGDLLEFTCHFGAIGPHYPLAAAYAGTPEPTQYIDNPKCYTESFTGLHQLQQKPTDSSIDHRTGARGRSIGMYRQRRRTRKRRHRKTRSARGHPVQGTTR